MPYVECNVCQKEFYAKPRHLKIGWGKYCSIECRSKAQFNGSNLKCANCGVSVYRTPASIKRSVSGQFFCSKSCHCVWENTNSRVAERSPRWQGGQNIYRLIMDRAGIVKACNECGIQDKRVLEVHHKDRDRNNNQLSNLVWLCCNCHRIKHSEHKKDMVAFV
ncbi:TPA: hypothetical protein DIV45_01695 [Patescibacteria group bacterium]|uniref:HNH nuclease domain-containing protein n=1 Tax=candidate division Kazan bacterium GW2011_GWA1_44_22 TaxID=1620410 RepID=A0A0G1I197_UNCK3|nr:MAG: hypothetical protein VE96_C0004G0002 [candidate division Kazan bacterium GW2011_GWA1_44_22]HCR42061.1 hypothetical protein [Patescibacteria group bacterium]